LTSNLTLLYLTAKSSFSTLVSPSHVYLSTTTPEFLAVTFFALGLYLNFGPEMILKIQVVVSSDH
jgi:hypothetical protein